MLSVHFSRSIVLSCKFLSGDHPPQFHNFHFRNRLILDLFRVPVYLHSCSRDPMFTILKAPSELRDSPIFLATIGNNILWLFCYWKKRDTSPLPIYTQAGVHNYSVIYAFLWNSRQSVFLNARLFAHIYSAWQLVALSW